MQIQEIINSREGFEPETLHILFPKLTDGEIELVQVLHLIKNTEYFWKDMNIFENCILVLNGVKPEVGFMQGVTPEQIWYGIRVASQLRSEADVSYSFEVKEYIKWICNSHGVYIYPPIVDLPNPYASNAIKIAKEGPFPIGDSTTEEIQAGKYLAIQMYIDSRLAEDAVKYNLEKTSEQEFEFYKAHPALLETEGGGSWTYIPPPFDPTRVSNLVYWYDANTIASGTGDRVSSWAPRVGNITLVSNSTDTQPYFYRNAPGFNGNAAFYMYSGVNGCCFSGVWNSDVQPYDQFTLFTVNSIDSTLPGTAAFSAALYKTIALGVYRLGIVGATIATETLYSRVSTSGGNIDGGSTFYCATDTANITSLDFGQGLSTVKVNNRSGNSTIVANNFIRTGDSTYGLFVGKNYQSVPLSSTWPGYISEIICYHRKLTDTEYTQVYNYLASKYGVTS